MNKYFSVLFLSIISLIAWLLDTTQMEKVCDSFKTGAQERERELDSEKGGENIPIPEGKRKRKAAWLKHAEVRRK